MSPAQMETSHSIGHPRTGRGWLSLLPPSGLRRIVLSILCVSVAATVTFILPDSPGLTDAGRRMLFITLLAGGLWLTDAIPAFSVGILVIALQIALLGKPGGVYARTDRDWEQFVSMIGHPLVWLFFGGFVLAAGMSQTGVDRWIAAKIVGRNGSMPPMMLGKLMLIAFVLSMMMSNTAATAMLLAILMPGLRDRPNDDRVARGLLLGLIFAANLGGMASLIGTPPNAIAVGNLAEMDSPVRISFLGWMLFGAPVSILLAAGAYALIVRGYFQSPERLSRIMLCPPVSIVSDDGADSASNKLKAGFVVLTLLTTVGMWMSTSWHDIPTAVIAFIPIVAFTCTGVLREQDVRGLPYDVLFLLAGGLALGQGLIATGLSSWLVSWISVGDSSAIVLALVIAYATLILSNFMSNTAAANLVIPLGLSLATDNGPMIAIPAAIAASSAMCLPVSTPPGAMVFSQGRLTSGELLRAGLLIGIVAPIIATLWVAIVLHIWPI